MLATSSIPDDLAFLATYELSAAITEQVSLDSYMDNFPDVGIYHGIVFEMPLVSWLLSTNRTIAQVFLP